MSTLVTLLTVLALTTVAGWLGRRLLRLAGATDREPMDRQPTAPPDTDPPATDPPGDGLGRGYRSVLAVLAGLLLVHLLLLALHGLGIPWTGLSVATVLALAAVFLHLSTRHGGRPTGGPKAPSLPRGWGDALAGVAVGGFTVATLALRATHPDFVYHWGIKGHKFLLAGGLDATYLARPWNHFIHPDYPRFLPELYAVTALPAGVYAERGLLLWSVLALLGLALALRQAAVTAGLADSARHTLVAVVMLGVAAFATGHRLAGGADLPLALAVAMGLAPLLARRPGPGHDLAAGVAAATALVVKMEGLPLAATLVALYGLHRWRSPGLRPPARSPAAATAALARILSPALLVGIPWLAINLRHGLFQAANSGAFEADRWPVILDALGDALAVPHWHGMAWILLAAPLLLIFRRSRPLALLVMVQLAFYGWIYCTMVGDPGVLVRFSFPRLALPLVIPTALGLALIIHPSTRESRSARQLP